MNKETRENLFSFTWRASAIGMGFLLLFLAAMAVAGDYIVDTHQLFFPRLPSRIVAAELYQLFGTMKIMILCLFVIPSLALWWQSRKD